MKTGDVGSGGTGECTVRLVRKTSGTDQEQGGAQIPEELIQTGDTANIIPWCIAGAVSFCVIIAAVKKRRNGSRDGGRENRRGYKKRY